MNAPLKPEWAVGGGGAVVSSDWCLTVSYKPEADPISFVTPIYNFIKPPPNISPSKNKHPIKGLRKV